MQIAFLGDSLTEGWPGAAYFPLLQKRMPQPVLLNLGRAGDSVADLLLRATHRGLDPVDLAFIWVGVNDAVMGAWDAAGDGAGSDWGWAERRARISGDYEELVVWTAARASRIVCVRPTVLEADGSVWQAHADEL
ncbi:MAG: SGNH/GDSL hydrolase family protein, partial [Actinobacteria bacterium]|nr:SGNH/GDSL hydrolase family protein [Actinomycetota bacterium]